MNLRRFYAISQIEYCQNFIFRRNFPIRKLFERSCELSFFSMTASKVSNIFGWRITRKFSGKLQTVFERVDEAHHTFRSYFKSSFVKQIVNAFELPNYTINQLRYDLRKMKAHGLIQRNGRQYSYVLTEKGVKVSTMFVLFHKRLCGPLANSLFQHQPNKCFVTSSKLEKAYHKADDYITKITEILAA